MKYNLFKSRDRIFCIKIKYSNNSSKQSKTKLSNTYRYALNLIKRRCMHIEFFSNKNSLCSSKRYFCKISFDLFFAFKIKKNVEFNHPIYYFFT